MRHINQEGDLRKRWRGEGVNRGLQSGLSGIREPDRISIKKRFLIQGKLQFSLAPLPQSRLKTYIVAFDVTLSVLTWNTDIPKPIQYRSASTLLRVVCQIYTKLFKLSANYLYRNYYICSTTIRITILIVPYQKLIISSINRRNSLTISFKFYFMIKKEFYFYISRYRLKLYTFKSLILQLV